MAEQQEGKKPRQIPRYQLTEKAYINDVILDPASTKLDEDGENKPLIIEFDGIPGPHMIPKNAAAEEMFKKHPPKTVDWAQALPIN